MATSIETIMVNIVGLDVTNECAVPTRGGGAGIVVGVQLKRIDEPIVTGTDVLDHIK
jgi:hypothetical protein